MKRKNLRIREKNRKKFGYCTRYRKEVPVFCSKCPFEIKYDLEKIKKSNNRQIAKDPKFHGKPLNKNCIIKKRSNKLAKAEKSRFSIIYQDLTKCCVESCLTPYYDVQKNEVFDGAYRQSSMKYGMVCPFCKNHHKQFHSDRKFAICYKILFENKFIELYDYDTFMKIFKIDYRYR